MPSGFCARRCDRIFKRFEPRTDLYRLLLSDASGLLAQESVEAADRCPENFVATGVVTDPRFSRSDPKRILTLRCQRLQTDRYRLGSVIHGSPFDLTIGAMHFIRIALGVDPPGPPPVRWTELPAGIRYAFGRSSFLEWSWSGCVPNPAGALLTGWGGSRCADLEFRPVFFAGSSPAAVQPVSVFPRCRAIDDPFSPDPQCVR